MASKKRTRREHYPKLSFGHDSPFSAELCQKLEQIDMSKFRDILDHAKARPMTKEEHALVEATVMSLVEAHQILDEAAETAPD